MRFTTLGTLMMSALFLAGCGGGTGSFLPRAANHAASEATGRQIKSFQNGLAAGDFKPVCGPVPAGRARCAALLLAGAPPASQARTPMSVAAARGFTPDGYGPADLQSAYRLTAAAKHNGEDSLVAIVVAYENPHAERDLAVYRAQYGLPPCTSANRCFQKVGQTGRSGALPPLPPADGFSGGWQVESSLDLDMVSANCPKCRILLVESNDDFMNNLVAAVDTAARLGAMAISNSYAAYESSSDPAPVSQGGLLAHYVHPHVAVVAATGDFGYALSGWNTGAVIPAAFPSVVAVGGTLLTPDSSSARGWSESAWDGGGSGCSLYEAMPAWQDADPNCVGTVTNAAGRTSSFASRIYGDVSYVASAYTGVAVYNTNGQFGTNGWGVLGGTSVASPAIAAIYGLAGYGGSDEGENDLARFPARKLYHARSALFDVTSGTNGACFGSYLCTAGPGYDAPTGNGSPNGIGAFSLGGSEGD